MWPLPTIKMDRKLFEELAADPEFTEGELGPSSGGHCAEHTPVEFYGEEKPSDFVEEAFKGAAFNAVREHFDAGRSVPTRIDGKLKWVSKREWLCEQFKRELPALYAIYAEQERQLSKWGQQDHPDLSDAAAFNKPDRVAEILGIPHAQYARARCEGDFNARMGNWAVILIEEVAEAIEQAALGNEQALQEELVQVGAVCASWAQAIGRRKGGVRLGGGN